MSSAYDTTWYRHVSYHRLVNTRCYEDGDIIVNNPNDGQYRSMMPRGNALIINDLGGNGDYDHNKDTKTLVDTVNKLGFCYIGFPTHKKPLDKKILHFGEIFDDKRVYNDERINDAMVIYYGYDDTNIDMLLKIFCESINNCGSKTFIIYTYPRSEKKKKGGEEEEEEEVVESKECGKGNIHNEKKEEEEEEKKKKKEEVVESKECGKGNVYNEKKEKDEVVEPKKCGKVYSLIVKQTKGQYDQKQTSLLTKVLEETLEKNHLSDEGIRILSEKVRDKIYKLKDDKDEYDINVRVYPSDVHVQKHWQVMGDFFR